MDNKRFYEEKAMYIIKALKHLDDVLESLEDLVTIEGRNAVESDEELYQTYVDDAVALKRTLEAELDGIHALVG